MRERVGCQRIMRSGGVRRSLAPADGTGAPRRGSECTVLIAGESGTGKEVLARYIHQPFQRAQRQSSSPSTAPPFPRTCSRRMLFGWERGAFTGAHGAHPGKFEQAQGGTLLLDEISEIPLLAAGEAAARAAGARGRAPGRAHRGEPGRARDRHHQSAPARGSCRRPLPRGSLLPAERISADAAAVALAARRHAAAGDAAAGGALPRRASAFRRCIRTPRNCC